MAKDAIIYTRVPANLKEKVDDAAEQRGMNISEFVRYALQIFFDPTMDSKPQNMYKVLVDPGIEYQAE